MVAKGDYSVPAEIRALRPAGVDCIVKKISGHYYVYGRKKVDDPKRPGRTKWVSDGIIGKIEGGRYVPNESDATEEEEHDGLEVKDYGAYAMLVSLTGRVRPLLTEALGWECGTQVFAQALCWEVEGYVPACRFADVFAGSVLSCAWPTLPVDEDAIVEGLGWLGINPAATAKVEEALEELGPTFGVMAPRANDADAPREGYLDYREIWLSETGHDHVSGGLDLDDLREQDRHVAEGATFVMKLCGLVHAALVRALTAADVPTVARMSAADCIYKAKRLKAMRREDGSWCMSRVPKEVTQMMQALGVDVTGDLERLNTGTFGV